MPSQTRSFFRRATPSAVERMHEIFHYYTQHALCMSCCHTRDGNNVLLSVRCAPCTQIYYRSFSDTQRFQTFSAQRRRVILSALTVVKYGIREILSRIICIDNLWVELNCNCRINLCATANDADAYGSATVHQYVIFTALHWMQDGLQGGPKMAQFF